MGILHKIEASHVGGAFLIGVAGGIIAALFVSYVLPSVNSAAPSLGLGGITA